MISAHDFYFSNIFNIHQTKLSEFNMLIVNHSVSPVTCFYAVENSSGVTIQQKRKKN